MTEARQTVKAMRDFFGCTLGGSYALVEAGLLDESDVSDIDVLIRSDKTRYSGAVNYARSLGYQSRTPVDKYGNTCREVIATKQGALSIHFCFQEKADTWFSDPIDILCFKMRRGSRRDWKHVEFAATSGLLINEPKRKATK